MRSYLLIFGVTAYCLAAINYKEHFWISIVCVVVGAVLLDVYDRLLSGETKKKC